MSTRRRSGGASANTSAEYKEANAIHENAAKKRAKVTEASTKSSSKRSKTEPEPERNATAATQLSDCPASSAGRRRANKVKYEESSSSDFEYMVKSSDDESTNSQDSEDADKEAEPKCEICSRTEDCLHCLKCANYYHIECLDLDENESIDPDSFVCTNCAEQELKLDVILDVRNPLPPESEHRHKMKLPFDEKGKKEFYVKWKDRSHLHNTWISEEKLSKLSLPKLKNFMKKKMDGLLEDVDETYVHGVLPDWMEVDRIVASKPGPNGTTQYLVKWRQLAYDQCTWEDQKDLTAFDQEIARFEQFEEEFAQFSSVKRSSKSKSKEPRKDPFVKFSSQPEFLPAGELFPYQLEGLNWLRFSYYEGKNVILADEMGLGKTVQSVSYILSLIEEGLADRPFLIIAPLSTITNWERELQCWCPKLNTLVMIGNLAARNTILEYELFCMRDGKKRKEGVPTFSRVSGRHHSPRFHVLITSYESVQQEESLLKTIDWESLIVDEAHRLKNIQSKLFQNINPFKANHRILLTGTPLQNNLSELYNLLSFLHPDKFNSIDEFNSKFSSLTESETITELHKMLAPHLLRRVKKDVLQSIPPKAELIVPVEMTPTQKMLYRAVYTRNYGLLKAGGAAPKLNNVLSDLQKTCNHPFLMNATIQEDDKEFVRKLVSDSSKMLILDQLLPKLKDQGHRVLIFSQMTMMLDLLEDYMTNRGYVYERIDGSVTGSLRQQAIDRFNAPGSNRFCFLISTRAGGLGINLATADTVIIYDSDWNPHNDMQALARAHRIGQKNRVLIYRLVTRSSVEEKILKRAREKLLLEHIVVRKTDSSGKPGLRQEELEEILRFGAAALFADSQVPENEDPTNQSDVMVHYDDEAIDKLLDRSQAVPEEEIEGQNEYLKSFKVADFASQRVESQAETEVKQKVEQNGNDPDFWKEVLGPHCPVDQLGTGPMSMMFDENLGKGKRQRKAINYYGKVAEEPIASIDDQDYEQAVEEEEDESESDESDLESENETGKKRSRDKDRNRDKLSKLFDPENCAPLMEEKDGELRVLGLGKRERDIFYYNFLMHGHIDSFQKTSANMVRKFPHLSKSMVRRYADLFIQHLLEPETILDFYIDGVPKEGVDAPKLLVRMAMIDLVHKKVAECEEAGTFDIIDHNKSGIHTNWQLAQHWTKIYDYCLLVGIVRHGYGRWMQILKDPSHALIYQAAAEVKQQANITASTEITNERVTQFIEERIAILERALYFENELREVF